MIYPLDLQCVPCLTVLGAAPGHQQQSKHKHFSEYLQLGCGCCINIDLIPSSCELRELCELYCCTCAASILIVSNIFLPDTLQSHLNANVNANKYLQISLSSEFTLSLAFS